jgi:hypothetical protein
MKSGTTGNMAGSAISFSANSVHPAGKGGMARGQTGTGMGENLILVGVLLTVPLVGCVSGGADRPADMLAIAGNQIVTGNSFSICHGHGCRLRSQVTLTADDWERIEAHFIPRPGNQADERKALAHAIATMEQISGAQTGTDRDKGGTFGGTLQPGQLDCEDESINTNLYLTLLANRGLLDFHVTGPRARRGMFINGWPHMTATIVERESHKTYVVDSWFAANGSEPFIVPLPEWKKGANPG